MSDTPLLGRAVFLGLATGLSPLGLIAVLAVIGERNRRNGAAFVLGWVLALAVLVVTASFVLQPAVGPDVGASKVDVDNDLLGYLEVVLAAMAAVGAVLLWRRPAPDPDAATSSRMVVRLEGVQPWGAFLGGMLVPAYPPAFVFGAELARTTASAGQRFGALVIFLIFTTMIVGAPVALMYAAPDRTASRLAGARAWTERRRARVFAGLLVLVSLVLALSGLEHLR